MDRLLNSYLTAIGHVILEVIDSQAKTVRLIDGENDWVTALFPQSIAKQSFVIDDELAFLDDFFIDARLIWSAQKNGRLKSGFWTQAVGDGVELHLEAIAIRQGCNNLLIIVNQSDEFEFRQRTLQMAREFVISNDRLVEQNEYLHNRLLTILKEPSEQNSILLTLTKAIESAGFAVIITDDKMKTMIENRASHQLFEQGRGINETTIVPVDIILGLMERQVPEFQRVLSTQSSWDGELCWMSPPATLKWLKVAFYPVKSELNEVKNWIVFVNDVSGVKFLIQRNEQLALQDLLTELPNRFSFWQTLAKKVESNVPFYLLYLDINEFRRHNEFYGHDECDNLLIELSNRLKSTIKKTDYLARVGGDEFTLILSDVDSQRACEAVIKRITKVTSKEFISKNSDSYRVTLSIGAASFPHDAQNVEELMRFVDLTAYSGKRKKKNNSVMFYSQELRDASHKIIALEHELAEAVKNQEFELYLQPIIDLQTNTIVKAEALIRWNHPKEGLVSPNRFIPIAEKSELIITIGKWVMNTSCQLLKELEDDGHKIKLSMNLSPSQVFDENSFSYLHSCVQKYQVDPSLLEVEVTEGVFVDDYILTDNLLTQIRSIGMSVSVDDFGTGYSSLAYLKKLPLDFLKIDQSFVRDIVTDDNDKAIVRAVIAMAHNLNLGVIAEGVETRAQLEFLAQNACDSVQGYLFSRPVPFDQFKRMLEAKE